MVLKKRGLGRGLNDLGLNELLGDITKPSLASESKQGDFRKIAIDFLQPGQFQPRKDMDFAALEELASSIRMQGIIQPIVVRRVDGGRYEIIAGERRWRAAKLAGLAEVPVIIKKLTDEATIAVALIENIQREDLNAIEEAFALNRLMQEFGMTHQQVAEAVGKSRSTVSNLLRLLNLKDEVKTLLQHGDIEKGHALILLAVAESQQAYVAKTIVEQGLSVREAETLIRQLTQPSDKKPKAKPKTDTALQEYAQQLSAKLQTKVVIHSRSGGGNITIRFRDIAELEHLIKAIDKP